MNNTKYLNTNGEHSKERPYFVCGYYVEGQNSGKKMYFITYADGILFHPSLSSEERGRAFCTQQKCSEEQYNAYRRFLQKRNDTIYKRLLREL